MPRKCPRDSSGYCGSSKHFFGFVQMKIPWDFSRGRRASPAGCRRSMRGGSAVARTAGERPGERSSFVMGVRRWPVWTRPGR
eukprot:7667694-Pyramimonas_sp.AAC.1